MGYGGCSGLVRSTGSVADERFLDTISLGAYKADMGKEMTCYRIGDAGVFFAVGHGAFLRSC